MRYLQILWCGCARIHHWLKLPFSQTNSQHRPMTSHHGRLAAFQAFHSIGELNIRARQPLGPPTHVACQINIIARRQAQNSPRSERLSLTGRPLRRTILMDFYIVSKPPRLHDTCGPTRNTREELVSQILNPFQDVSIYSSLIVPFLRTALVAVRTRCPLTSWKPDRALLAIKDSESV